MQRFALALALLAIPAPAFACASNQVVHTNCVMPNYGAVAMATICTPYCADDVAPSSVVQRNTAAFVRAFVNARRARRQRAADDTMFAPIPEPKPLASSSP